MNIQDMLLDMYDIKNKLKQLKVINKPKDIEGSVFTLGDCCDNIINQLEDEERKELI